MEQISWNLSLNSSSGIALGDKGSNDVGASTSIPVSLDPESSRDLDLQLADVTKVNVLSISSSLYDGSVELTSNGNTYKLTGPLVLFGAMVERFSADLTTLTVENKHASEQAELKMLIGRTLA